MSSSTIRLAMRRETGHDRIMFKRASDLIKRVPAADGFITALQNFGIWKYLLSGFAALIGAAYSAWVWAQSYIPLWIIPIFGAWLVAVILQLFCFIDKTYIQIRSRVNQRKLGNELIRLSTEMRKSISDYDRTHARLHNPRLLGPERDSIREWQADRQEDDLATGAIVELFGAQIMTCVIRMAKLKIKIPFHISCMTKSTLPQLASYLGAIGSLLISDQLEIAQSIDDETEWALSHVVR